MGRRTEEVQSVKTTQTGFRHHSAVPNEYETTREIVPCVIPQFLNFVTATLLQVMRTVYKVFSSINELFSIGCEKRITVPWCFRKLTCWKSDMTKPVSTWIHH